MAKNYATVQPVGDSGEKPGWSATALWQFIDNLTWCVRTVQSPKSKVQRREIPSHWIQLATGVVFDPMKELKRLNKSRFWRMDFAEKSLLVA